MMALILSFLSAQLYYGTVDLVPVTLAITLFAQYLLSNQMGKWLFFRHPNDTYGQVTLGCLVLIGLQSILSAIDAF